MRLSVFAFVAALVTAACQPWGMSYTPKLAEPASSNAKFESDLQFCRNDMIRRMDEAEARHANDAPLAGVFGAAGAAADYASGDKNDDFYKSQSQVIDECMAARGYKVAGQ